MNLGDVDVGEGGHIVSTPLLVVTFMLKVQLFSQRLSELLNNTKKKEK